MNSNVSFPISDSQFLNGRLWNARSVSNKTTAVSNYIIEEDVDIMFVTETWLNINDALVVGECTPPCYDFLSFPRGTDDHGGITFIYKQSMNLQTVNLKLDMVTFEHASVIDPRNNVQYIVVYRPPPSTENGFRLSTFLHEFDIFIGEITLRPGKVILAGDFNMHVDVPSKSDVKCF